MLMVQTGTFTLTRYVVIYLQVFFCEEINEAGYLNYGKKLLLFVFTLIKIHKV